MLPRSWRREADSKSNSSSLLPLVTTIRVSSGWVASTSILFVAIKGYSMPSRADAAEPVCRPVMRGALRGTWVAGNGAWRCRVLRRYRSAGSRGSAKGAAGDGRKGHGQSVGSFLIAAPLHASYGHLTSSIWGGQTNSSGHQAARCRAETSGCDANQRGAHPTDGHQRSDTD